MAGGNCAMKEGDWNCPGCGDHQFARNVACRKCATPRPSGFGPVGGCGGGGFGMQMNQMNGGMMNAGGFGGGMAGVSGAKPGDWSCGGCGDHQFGRNEVCRKCGSPKSEGTPMDGGMGGGMAGGMGAPMGGGMAGGMGAPMGGGMAGGMTTMKPGDWNCPGCGDHQFGRNDVCRKCGTPKPANVESAVGNIRPGDWACEGCGDHQFARNAACRKCGTPKPEAAYGEEFFQPDAKRAKAF